jgi:beta-mannosidase
MATVRRASNYELTPLTTGWELLQTSPAELSGPEALPERGGWEAAVVPGTVASARRARGVFDFETSQDLDEAEFWYRCRFEHAPVAGGESVWLRFDGLATLATIWLNGRELLRSDNMYLTHELEVTSALAERNELVLRFASVARATQEKRPRPGFRTRIVDRQQLRYVRTTLLGRAPGFTPPVAPVGPWRDVVLEHRRGFSIVACDVRPRLSKDGNGSVRAALELSAGHDVTGARLTVGEWFVDLDADAGGFSGTLGGFVPEPWWPRPYGKQPRYACRLDLRTGSGTVQLELDPLAFRRVTADTSDGRFALRVNGLELRCFGACWTPTDVLALHDPDGAAAAVGQVCDAGMTMLRVGGTMVYESDAFYEACDAQGILVWQDFMFANFDYPSADPAFLTSVQAEARQLLGRLSTRACVTVLCGSSEVEQQIAMLGLPRERWRPALFEQGLRELCAETLPDLPYVPSTPTGGAWPFQADTGVTHYYGVGAYLRPLEDARRAEVKFAAECLAFANVPEQTTVDSLLGDVRAPFHTALWKARVPRDNGSGWDFEDVRDHYTRLLFGLDPTLLRYQDPERALLLGRIASGHVIGRTLAEWRRGASTCRGALIWWLRDLWPGAGWGLVDAHGIPKAAYYFAKRSLTPLAVFLSDEGVNGLGIELVNASPESVSATLTLTLWRDGAVRVATGTIPIVLSPHQERTQPAGALLESFVDLTHAYRFGPPAYEVAEVTLQDAAGAELAADYYFPSGLPHRPSAELGLEGVLSGSREDGFSLIVQSARFAHCVAVEVPGYAADDSYFHLRPGRQKRVRLLPTAGVVSPPRGHLRALNSGAPARITTASRAVPAGQS